MIALEYFEARKLFSVSGEKTEDDSLDHLLKCPKCREWFHEIVPAKILKRQKRITQYCCASMYCAVEEHSNKKDLKIKFTMFRGEDPCWLIDGKNTFIIFCPWCGKKLPEKPF